MLSRERRHPTSLLSLIRLSNILSKLTILLILQQLVVCSSSYTPSPSSSSSSLLSSTIALTNLLSCNSYPSSSSSSSPTTPPTSTTCDTETDIIQSSRTATSTGTTSSKITSTANMSASATMLHKVFVVGATGATGKHVVQQLLDKGENVVALARSKEKLKSLLRLPSSASSETVPTKIDEDITSNGQLIIHEGSILDMTESQLREYTKDCKAVVSCLGHNPTMSGLFGEPKRLVTQATERLTKNMPSQSKFILMGTEAVTHTDNNVDPKRSRSVHMTLSTLRYLLPPHADNEDAVAYLQSHKKNDTSDDDDDSTTFVPWSIVRPTNLKNDDDDGVDRQMDEYALVDHPQGDLFGKEYVTRTNVAHFIVQLVIDDDVWEKYKYKMPVMKPKNWINIPPKQ